MTSALCDKQIVLGVCGGIAAYKSVILLRLLTGQGARVRVIMTRNAAEFVGPLTFAALSGKPVCRDLFREGDSDAAIRHIEWAQEADGVVVAPATANLIGKYAGGVADDALSTFLLAAACPVMICPSMNSRMYLNPSVRRNLDRLRADGHRILEPESGALACHTTGPGRLPEPEFIADRLTALLTPKDFAGKNVLVTAGPTREFFDPVRFISNPSSGKMGFAVARAAEHRGARVTLVTGPTALGDPPGVETLKITTAAEMARAVHERMAAADILIKSAAVSDYRPADCSDHKIKKGDEDLVIRLTRNEDILKTAGAAKTRQFLVGFAAETRDLTENAQKKLAEKNLDLIVGNLVGGPAGGFGTDVNRVSFFFRDGGREVLEEMSKDAVAHVLLDRIRERMAR